MESYKTYRNNLETRFHFRISFWSGILNFFTLSSPYDEAIERLQNMDARDALKSDAHQLHRDFLKACKK